MCSRFEDEDEGEVEGEGEEGAAPGQLSKELVG